jgi:hypothetical protein
MSDITTQLQIPEARLERIVRDGDDITLYFSRVYLVQEMEGAFEDSLWTQAVNITVSNCEIEGKLPDCPCELGGGDFIDNVYTYRNHVALPISWRGDVGCKLGTTDRGDSFIISGDGIRSEQIGNPTYLKHIKK